MCQLRRLKCGFTLIELLVVIAVIALLLAILVPALQKARFRANEMVCASRLRQINVALIAYAHDDDQSRYPLEPTEHNPHPRLLEKLNAYRDESLMKVFYCPQAKLLELSANNPDGGVPKGGVDSVIDTPANREAGNITYIYWSFVQNKMEASGETWREQQVFYPRALMVGGVRWLAKAYDDKHPLPSAPASDRWVMSDFFRKGGAFPHGRKGGQTEGGLNVAFLDGRVGRVFKQPKDSWR